MFRGGFVGGVFLDAMLQKRLNQLIKQAEKLEKEYKNKVLSFEKYFKKRYEIDKRIARVFELDKKRISEKELNEKQVKIWLD